MSKLIALRLPDDVHAEVRKRMGTAGQSHFIINALRVYLEQIEPGNPASWQQFGAGVPLSTEDVNYWDSKSLASLIPAGLYPATNEITAKVRHAATCQCLMCKPPKGGA